MLTLDLKPETEKRLRRAAEKTGKPIERIVEEAVDALPAETEENKVSAEAQEEIAALLNELQNASLREKPMSGADAIAYWKANGLLGSYGDLTVDAVELARQLRSEAERRSSSNA